MKKIKDKARGRLARIIASSLSLVEGNGKASVPKIYFCHVPKCAGSSIASAIWDQVYSGLAVKEFKIDLAPSRRAAKVLGTSMMRSREAILAYNLSIQKNYFGRGHCYCRPDLVGEFSDDWDFVTILRHPVDRWISEYVYNSYKESSWVKNELPLSEYLESKKGFSTGQCLVRCFSNASQDVHTDPSDYIEEALYNLSRFSVVGTVNKLDDWTTMMNHRFGISLDIPKMNVSPKNQKADEIRSDAKVMKRIEELCKYDLEFYYRYFEKNG